MAFKVSCSFITSSYGRVHAVSVVIIHGGLSMLKNFPPDIYLKLEMGH